MKKSPRILGINPWIYDFSAFDLWSKPIGLLYVLSYLRSVGYEINFIDCLDKYHPKLLERQKRQNPKMKRYGTGPFFREKMQKPRVLNFVPRHFARYGLPENIFIEELKKLQKPDAILVTSFMTYWYLGPKRVIEIVREIFPGVPIILGGIYATLVADHARNVLQPDYIIEGSGEIQCENLLSEILSNAPARNEQPKVLDDFPHPAFDLYNKLDYLVVMTSRGCPYHCTFCATDKISGKYAQRQPDCVTDEILRQTQKLKVRDVAFYDDALLLNKNQRLKPILRTLSREKLKLRFHTPNGLHAKQIDEELAQLFFDSGFKTIRMSFETVNPQRQLDMYNKVTPGDLEQAVIFLQKAGFERKKLEAYVMMGLPDQSFEEVYQSILFVNSLGIKVILASFSPIPGTVDYQRAIERGLFPENADPLLTNKTGYPMYRTEEAYWKFHKIRQFVSMLNQGINRKVNLFESKSLRNALRNTLGSTDY